MNLDAGFEGVITSDFMDEEASYNVNRIILQTIKYVVKLEQLGVFRC